MTQQIYLTVMAAKVVNGLISRKNEIENEIKELTNVLETQGTNMTDELIDSEGFPRSDVDVLTVRKTRVRIIYLQNDLKHLMKQIEEGLYKIHAEARETKNNEEMKQEEEKENTQKLEPFLKVDVVTKTSPAEKAGLEVNDLILRFGSITFQNFSGLQMVGSVVQNSKEKTIDVDINRDGRVKSLKLTPTTWSGKGLLGCNVVPIKK